MREVLLCLEETDERVTRQDDLASAAADGAPLCEPPLTGLYLILSKFILRLFNDGDKMM